MTPAHKIVSISKPLVFALCLTPLALMVWKLFGGGLGANPVETVNRQLGDWALRFLLITLAVSPLCWLTGRSEWGRFRRMLGLFAFAYAALHVANYLAFEQSLVWADVWGDVLKRSYITVGLLSGLILIPLAATSPKAMIKRLGAKRWKKLHRTVYVAAIAAVFHYAMMVKADLREPLIYAAVLALLLGWRAVKRGWPWSSINEPRPNLRRFRRRPPEAPPAPPPIPSLQ